VTVGGRAAMPGDDPGADPYRVPGVVTAGGDDGEGCLCLVASYSKRAGLIARMTAEAMNLITMSPMLSDFLQLRFVDLGPEPGQAGDRFRPVRRVAAELGKAPGDAGRNHFALIVVDKSAMAIEELVGRCGAEPFLAGLRMRFAGISSRDDRPDDGRFANIASSPTGTWQREKAGELVDALYRQCEELLPYFATRGEPGLTPAEFATLRRLHEHSAPDVADEGAQEDEAVPDLLDDADDGTGGAVAGGAPAAAQQSGLVVLGWLPKVPWYRRNKVAQAPVGVPVPAPEAMGLVHLFVAADPDAGEDPALGHLRAAILQVDKRLAAQHVCSYRVRLVYGADGDLRGELGAAGQLGRRAAHRSVRAGDFAALFKGVRAALRRDGVLVEAAARAEGLTVARPAVVVFTADPPMADGGAVVAFRDLAAEATVVWVVPKDSEGLVSPAFSDKPGVAVVTEYQTVAEDIWAALWSPAVYAASRGAAS
jgi:hypothetical protein